MNFLQYRISDGQIIQTMFAQDDSQVQGFIDTDHDVLPCADGIDFETNYVVNGAIATR
jgi:hypothetical protein